MQSVEELLVQIVSKMDDNGFKKLDKLETQATKQTSILSKQLKNLFVGVLGNIGAKEIIDASVKLDTLNKSFAALAGSDAGGAEQIKYLRQETERLGQDFVTAADAYKNLFSAGVGTGMNPEEIQKIFSSVLEAGTVLGSSEQQMQGALMALEQMISKGKVSMEELRRQLGNALPGAMQIAARAMNTTSEGLQEMLEAGLDSKKFVTAFANQLHYEFGDKAVKASHTLRAELARLKNAFFDLKVAFLDENNTDSFAKIIQQITALLKNPVLLKSVDSLGKTLVFLLKNIRFLVGIGLYFGIKRLVGVLTLARLNFLTTTFAAGTLGAALQMDAGVASIKALGFALWATLRPLALIAAGLLIIIELIDTINGKKTLTSQMFELTTPRNPFYDPNASIFNPLTGNQRILPGSFESNMVIFSEFKSLLSDIQKKSGKVTGGAASIGYSGVLPDLNQSKVTSPNNFTLNFYTNSNLNEELLAQFVQQKILGVFEDYNLYAGYVTNT